MRIIPLWIIRLAGAALVACLLLPFVPGAGGAVAQIQSTVTIAAQADSAVEGESAGFVVSRSGGDSSGALTVRLSYARDRAPGHFWPASAGDLPATVTIGAGASTAEVTFPLTDNANVGSSGSAVTATIDAHADYVVGSPDSATVTVIDDGDVPLTVIAPTEDLVRFENIGEQDVAFALEIVTDGRRTDPPDDFPIALSIRGASARLHTSGSDGDFAVVPGGLPARVVDVSAGEWTSTSDGPDGSTWRWVADGVGWGARLVDNDEPEPPERFFLKVEKAQATPVPLFPGDVDHHVPWVTVYDDEIQFDVRVDRTGNLEVAEGDDLEIPLSAESRWLHACRTTGNRNNVTNMRLTIDLELIPGSAAHNSDFRHPGTTNLTRAVTFSGFRTVEGDADSACRVSATATVRIDTVDDNDAEGAEDFTLRFAGRTTPFDRHVAFQHDEVTVDVQDDDATGGLSVGDATAGEGDGALDFTVTLGAPHSQDVTVDYATADGTATEPADYTATSGTLTILAGDSSATISVPVIDDTDDESTETLTLRLTNPTNTTITDKTATGTILNNDGASTVRVVAAGGGSAVEGESAGFVVSRSGGDSTGALTVRLSYAMDSAPTHRSPASAGDLPATVTIGAGESTAEVTFPLTDNAAVGSTGAAVTATIDAHADYVVGSPDSATVTVIDDGDVPLRVVAPTEDLVRFENIGDQEIDFDVEIVTEGSRTDPPDGFPIVMLLRGGSARPHVTGSDGDFVVVPSGIIVRVVDVSPGDWTSTSVGPDGSTWRWAAGGVGWGAGLVDNDEPEPPERFSLKVERWSGTPAPIFPGGIDHHVPWVTVYDDEIQFEVRVDRTGNLEVTEGDDLEIPLIAESRWLHACRTTGTQNNITDMELAFDLELIPGSAAHNSDFRHAGSTDLIQGVTFSGFRTVEGDADSACRVSATATVSIETVDDNDAEGAEDFTLRFAGRTTPLDRHVAFQHDEMTVDIRDDDATGGLSVGDATAGEGDGTLDFTVTLGAPHSQDVTVDYATADGTATAPADYTHSDDTLTITVGDTSATISVPIIDDTDEESTETLTLHLSNATNTTISDKTATGTILNDDRLPRVSVADASAPESRPTMVFTVSLRPTGTRDVTVEYNVTEYRTDYGILPDSATVLNDYRFRRDTLRIPAGATSGTVEVDIVDDSEIESNERFLLRLTNATNAVLADDTAVGTIIDNDRRVVRSSSRQRADAPAEDAPAEDAPAEDAPAEDAPTTPPDAPSIAFFPSDRDLGIGDPPAVVDIADAFEGTVDSYGAVADDEAVVDVQMSGSALSLTALAEGVTRISVSATNARGAALLTFRVQVLDLRAPRTRSFPGEVVLNLGDPPTLLDIAAAFDGTIDRYNATQADPSVVEIMVSGSEVSLTGLTAGVTEVTVSATNPRGAAVRVLRVTVQEDDS